MPIEDTRCRRCKKLPYGHESLIRCRGKYHGRDIDLSLKGRYLVRGGFWKHIRQGTGRRGRTTL